MRHALYDAVADVIDTDPTAVVVVADLGAFPRVRTDHPDRFINVGVAEPNSAGIAAGLASQGKRVFLYGVAGFTLYRAFEQIKFAIGYWQQRVCIIGTGFGWRYWQIGRGHHAPDDIALMRLVPNMRVFAPATGSALRRVIRAEPVGPCYVRIGEGLGFESGLLAAHSSVTAKCLVVALGEMAAWCADTVTSMRTAGVDVGLVPVEDLSVAGVRACLPAPEHLTALVVLEDHIAMGGLGETVRAAGYPIACHLHLPVNVEQVTDSVQDLLCHYGLGQKSLEAAIHQCMARTSPFRRT